MKVAVKYMAQARQAAGVSSESVEVESPCSAQQLLQRLAEKHGPSFRNLVLDPAGELQRSILLFVGDEQVCRDRPMALQEGDVITILTPIAGG